MLDGETVLRAQQNPELREQLIANQMEFIRRCAAQAAGRFVDSHDDACSEAMIAFNDAITAYRPEKGNFSAFAAAVIRNRVTDQLRRESRHAQCIPFSALAAQDDQGEEQPFELEDPAPMVSDAALEIDALRQELDALDISFFDLPKASPKAGKTRTACLEVVHYLLGQPEMMQGIQKSGCLPSKQIMETLGTNRKVLERYRKYILAGVLICGGGYPIMRTYFDG